jgi:hypothetical protein
MRGAYGTLRSHGACARGKIHTQKPCAGVQRDANGGVTDVWAGLDLYLLSLPLRVGFEKQVDILVDDDKPQRPFKLSVERIERVRVPAGEIESFRIRVDPLDGDDRMRSIYHVRTTSPGVVVRKEYVVNPRTEGEMKQSTGIEELEAVGAATAAVPTAHR